MPLPLHLVAVWNPAYAADAMQVHTSLLLDWMQRFHEHKAADHDACVCGASGAGQAGADQLTQVTIPFKVVGQP